MSDYNEGWSASCPRCSFKVTPEALPMCRNCGKGRMLVQAINSYGLRRMSFGCPQCNVSLGSPNCPKCGASVEGVARLTAWAAGLRVLRTVALIVLLGVAVVVGTIAFIAWAYRMSGLRW
jgi:hypothetical protein